MDKLIPIGRTFFALALIGLGIEHFIFQDFITGRAPAWPASVPGKLIWAYLTGALFIVIGVAILSRKKARPAAVLASVLICLWALLRHIPVVAADSLLSGAWTQAGKALTFVGGTLAIAATFPKMEMDGNTSLMKAINLKSEFILVGRICLGLFLVLTGIQHFLFTEFVASLIPAWFPGDAVFWTYFAGMALVAGGVGLFIPQTARLAALLSGLMVFSWFWIVHLPRTFLGVSDSIAVFEALAVSGIALVLAGYLRQREGAVYPDMDSVSAAS
ncbi:MAG TPA: hypothetical protein VKP65_12230 [Rhodothermales bacterium]|nr:hypothetical protein [Rhodothermales bacterium]